MILKHPTKLACYRGKQFYRFFVRATQSGLDRDLWKRQVEFPVTSDSAVAAVRLVQQEIAPLVNDPTEFECAGPKGGVTHRFTGYESLIWAKMCAVNDTEHQLTFQYEKV